MKKNLKTRREFLGSSLATLGTLNLTPFVLAGLGLRPVSTFAAGKRRRHLINIVDIGGWDSYWFHNATTSRESANGQARFGARYTASEVVPFPDGNIVGPGFKSWTTAELQKLLIWRGMIKEGDHGIGNLIVNQGNASSYASSFAALIAHGTALEDYIRPLHYVQLSSKASDILVSPGLLKGYALAANITDQAAWSQTTTPSSKDIPATRRELFDKALADLTNLALAPQLKLGGNKATVSDFLASYQGSASIGNTGYSNSPEFRAMWKRYFLVLKNAYDTMMVTEPTKRWLAGVTYENPVYQLETIQVSNDVNQADDVINGNNNSQAFDLIRTMSWKFALTEFLIVKDLSAVVDLNPTGGDNHFGVVSDFVIRTGGFAGFRELMRSLSSILAEDGKTLLDHTTMVYTSEFDRGPRFTNGGTDHGNSVSAVLAGQGVASGKIIGALGDGSDAMIASSRGPIGTPLPTDVTGQANPAGKIQSSKSIFPTVVEIFGLQVPPQQQTEWTAFAPAINPAKRIS